MKRKYELKVVRSCSCTSLSCDALDSNCPEAEPVLVTFVSFLFCTEFCLYV